MSWFHEIPPESLIDLALWSFVTAVFVFLIAREWRADLRQRRYRQALARRDWPEVHRLMGFRDE